MEIVSNLMRHPLLVFALSFLLMWSAGRIGVAYSDKRPLIEKDHRDDFGVILGASLTLLDLIVGFYLFDGCDSVRLRKSFEEGEANAIGAEQVRADLLPPEAAANLRMLLVKYWINVFAFTLRHKDRT